MTASVHAGALRGLRVIDFGQYIAGPLAAMQMADHGADVIRVDPPGGPRWTTPANAMWNRGKRSITLDLKQAVDLKIARRLIATADVVIENFRPGVMTRLGLDAGHLTHQNPHLIWCSLPGFASDDPRAGVPAWEGLLGAASGNFTLNVQALRDDAGRRLPRAPVDQPIYTMTPVSSIYAGCLAALSIAMALIARQRDGRGQRIEVPLYDSTFCAIGSPKWAGIPGTPWTRSYECADGRWVDMVGYHAKFIRAFLRAAGVEAWLDQDFIGNIARPFKQEPARAAILVARMEALFRTRSALEWETLMAQAGVPMAVCRTSAEWMALAQARESQAIVELQDPQLGRVLQPGIQARLDETPGGIGGPAPTPDQHREEVLAELAALPPRTLPLTATPDPRPPLDGLRVIDLGTVLVGPACGRMLAEFGADVIKIDDPTGQGPGIDVGRGKRSILLDLRQPLGREVLARLADGCDVFLHNFRLGVAEKLGIGFEQLRARNPGLVGITYALYGRIGPWAGRPGYENQAQAATGMMERFGGGPPVMEPFPLNDYGTALTGTFGVALALYRRNQLKADGMVRGQLVDTALVYTASLLQALVMNDHAGKVWDEPRGQQVLGSGPLHRCYRAADGWFFLAAREDQLSSLESVGGLTGVGDVSCDERAAWLEARFATAPMAGWVASLRLAGVGAHRVATVSEVMADPWAREKGLYLERAHPDGGTVATIGPIPRLSHTPLVPGRVLRPSMEAAEIVAEAGMADQLDELLARRAVVIKPPQP
jgi:crotonobetainyl-CoA:carnitine CoA-transferase CaiB-like acyl-CoA transferase